MRFVIPDTIPRAALITGGGQRRAQAIGQALSDAGFQVAFQCGPGTAVPERGAALIADLADEDQAAALPGRAVAALGPVGVLINAASATHRDTWNSVAPDTWDVHMRINLRTPFVLIRQFALALPPDSEGVAINLLDKGAASLALEHLSYSASKAALWNLTQSLALALAPRIRVNGIGRGNDEEIARAALAILAFRSMTGQMIAPDGVPPPDP